MTRHVKVCKKRPKDGAPLLPPQSLNDEESVRVNDTESQLSHYENSDGDEEEVGQKRPPVVGVEQLENAVKKPPVPLFQQDLVPEKTEETLASRIEFIFNMDKEQRDEQEEIINKTVQQLKVEREQYLSKITQ